jgi:hypothetical protein
VLTDFSTRETSAVLSSVSTAVARMVVVAFLRREPDEDVAGLQEGLRVGKERVEVEDSDEAARSELR